MSKVYEKPDWKVARVWESEGSQVPWVVFSDGRAAAVFSTDVGSPIGADFSSRWRPYVPGNTEPWPPKPPRVKAPRRCWAFDGKERRAFVRMPEIDSYHFLLVNPSPAERRWWRVDEVTDVTYIDPDNYLDELGVP